MQAFSSKKFPDKNSHMKDMPKKPICWVLSEGIAGTENQCLGVAEALGLEPEIKRVMLQQPWKSLSPYLGFEMGITFTPALHTPWPDLLIASGRKSIAASRYIKRKSGGKCFTVQIQDPRIDPATFDLVALAKHDPTRGENVLVTTASPNRITEERLDQAVRDFPALKTIKLPRVAVLIGGNSQAYHMSTETMRNLCDRLKLLDAGLMITASRRTGEENLCILQEEMGGHPDTYIWDGTGENPYFGFLSWADFIFVTADSASMLSEAATTGKPVYMISLEGGSKRMRALHKNLMDAGAVRFFDKRLESWCYPPLNDAQVIATRIKEELKKRDIEFT